MSLQRIDVIDSHTGGEPTRVIIDGGPDLGTGPMSERLQIFREQHDAFRNAVVNEPRGSDILVGALLCPPSDPLCLAGLLFFNNVGYLGMCGHGTIGVMVTLAYLECLPPHQYALETPVGVVTVDYRGGADVAFRNVPSYRHAANVTVDVPGIGTIVGDVAWGGNWFFLVQDHGQVLDLARTEALTDFTWKIRQALHEQGITGVNGAEIDHIELFGPPTHPDADSKNFVLCPGKAYDRSPCGTGTSAKVACLLADGKLQPGQVWRQESITGSVFAATVDMEEDKVVPTIAGRAYVIAEAALLLDEADPLRLGIRVKPA